MGCCQDLLRSYRAFSRALRLRSVTSVALICLFTAPWVIIFMCIYIHIYILKYNSPSVSSKIATCPFGDRSLPTR